MDKKELIELIAEKTRLTKLNLSKQSFDELPLELFGLTSLIELDISDNNLTRLPPEIGNLSALEVLDISRNKITELHPKIGNLERLVRLDASNNDLAGLPAQIGKLTNLVVLRLSGNHLYNLPNEIGNLQRLEIIIITGNRVRSLPAEIGNLNKLSLLECPGNLLQELPKEIGKLTALNILYLSGNPLTSLPVEIGLLENLKILHLTNSKLRRLPQEIVELHGLEDIRVAGNPLRFPPIQVATQGFKAIKDYILSVRKDEIGKKILFEAKLMIVGQGGVGKTSLLNRLLFNFYDERDQPTKGVDIETWDKEIAKTGIAVNEWNLPMSAEEKSHIRMNVWDFGGQEIYHATHQFFLTKDSIYLLVWDSRQGDEEAQLYRWLLKLEAFAGGSPIILVLNKCDIGIRDVNLRDLRERFPQIRSLYQVSCKKPEKGKHTFELLTKEITKVAIELLEEGTIWSNSWLNIRRAIEADNRNYMAYLEYLDLCAKYDIEEREAKVLSKYLHKLGIILHFQGKKSLRDILILKPTWITDAVYAILDAQSVRDQNGVLRHSELRKIWDPDHYPEIVYSTLLELLNMFELAYELPDKESHLVPENLPSADPEATLVVNKKGLRFFYIYDFLPASIMTRFIVLVHNDLEIAQDDRPLCWREGAVLHWEETRAFVKTRKLENLIEVEIEGYKRRELLAVIRHKFAQIHRSMKMRFTQQIPCNCSPECQNRFVYERLLEAEAKGKTSVECQQMWTNVPLSSLLDGYERKEEREKLYTEAQTGRGQSISLYDDATIILGHQDQLIVKKEETIKQEKVINIGNEANISAPIVIADTIESSFNTLTKSAVDDDIKTLLTQLLREVTEVSKKVPQDKAVEVETMVRDAEALSKEVASSKPRRQWYEVSLDGLKQAAINIGEIAKPVLAIVSRLRPVLLP
ncbi:MAG: leucine-rich repeat domain-containing protein [Desulfobacteraceae bacterium]|nr:leucine-rich repeat domain-containing protein [Desulfobacteraceae bacterium]